MKVLQNFTVILVNLGESCTRASPIIIRVDFSTGKSVTSEGWSDGTVAGPLPRTRLTPESPRVAPDPLRFPSWLTAPPSRPCAPSASCFPGGHWGLPAGSPECSTSARHPHCGRGNRFPACPGSGSVHCAVLARAAHGASASQALPVSVAAFEAGLRCRL